jgi:AcrR family transcriptional regulator
VKAPSQTTSVAESSPARPGRKRDHTRDGVILDSTLAVLGEHGYEGMTIDLVAAHAGMARATVYRRWPTKTDLVVAAVSHLSRGDVDSEQLPDTGTLRGDMVAMIRPFGAEQQQLRMQAVVALMAVAQTDDRLAAVAEDAGTGPWTEACRVLIQRAVDRGEYPPPADLDTLAAVLPMLCISRAVRRLPITRSFSLAVIDGVVLPALRGG